MGEKLMGEKTTVLEFSWYNTRSIRLFWISQTLYSEWVCIENINEDIKEGELIREHLY